jgi:hypothetical protein
MWKLSLLALAVAVCSALPIEEETVRLSDYIDAHSRFRRAFPDEEDQNKNKTRCPF